MNSNIPKYKVELTYFRIGGKYYTGGQYFSGRQWLYEIWDEVKFMATERKLPGLIDGTQTPWLILANVPGHPHEHPVIIMVESLRKHMWNIESQWTSNLDGLHPISALPQIPMLPSELPKNPFQTIPD